MHKIDIPPCNIIPDERHGRPGNKRQGKVRLAHLAINTAFTLLNITYLMPRWKS
ncbi:hypothetical protein KSZ_60910 [Dictyobacter formicarum]|uniref:Transposase DDE domain-containing protein n=1 Tax=Dictyobacter formicarum TaxID=2778368 RepID=A0ABQ3VQ29_9CHLR|nr:hypothetical protein KSZ_60910 [Dictyobacter formicarum]